MAEDWPQFHGGRFYIRHDQFLYAYDIRTKASPPRKRQEIFPG